MLDQVIIGWFEAEGLIEVRRDCLHFADEAARLFANGGWLEQHVYAVVRTLRWEGWPIQDIGRGAEVSRQVGGEKVCNELDVAFLAENRLYVIECKTRRFTEEPETGGIGAEALYKLETLSNLLGGLQAKAMLVSYQPLNPTILRRARDYRILTCAGTELQDLKEWIQQWMK